MSQAIQPPKGVLQSSDPRRQTLGRVLQPIEQQPAQLHDVTIAGRSQDRPCMPRLFRRRARSVHRGGCQAGGWPGDDQVQRFDAFDRFDPLTSTTTQAGTAMQEKRHITP